MELMNFSEGVPDALMQGPPTPGSQTGTEMWPVRNWVAQQDMRSRQASNASSVFTAMPYHSK